MFAAITVTPACQTWALEGPACLHLDQILACAVMAGCTAESIAPGTRYRLTGDDAWLTLFADEVGKLADASVTLAHEVPPAGITLSTRVEPDRAYRRTLTVNGLGAEMVARAIDRGLRVTCAGANRWAVTGASSALAAWVGSDLAERLGMTAAAIAAEDAGLSVSVTVEAPVVNVTDLAITSMPDRKTTITVDRGLDGEIISATHVERDV